MLKYPNCTYIHGSFICLDLDKNVAGLEGVSWFHFPARNAALRHGGAHRRHVEVMGILRGRGTGEMSSGLSQELTA